MTDLNSGDGANGPGVATLRGDDRRAGEGSAPLADTAADEASIALIELFFFAYRDFTGDADARLEELGFGRAHHRVLHFVWRNPGLRVADLLDILKITKQSLARVLRQLVEQGYVEQRAGAADRRERHLSATQRGAALMQQLIRLQSERIARALVDSGPDSEAAAKRFLYAMIGEADRGSVAALTGCRPQLGAARSEGETT